ncbi:MAG: glutathione metabolism protein [Rhodopseudomonas sp.]|nr:glutathione metabolism protein [Rhodopseudomonas sp.]
MGLPVITAFYAGLIALLFVALSVNVIRTRRALRISLGHGNRNILERRIRAHGNCAEYAPFGIILMALAESVRTDAAILHTIGILLLIGRLAHAFALSGEGRGSMARVVGMALTFASLFAAAVACIWGFASFSMGR